MSPISLQTASPSPLIGFVPFYMWTRSTRYPQTGCFRHRAVMHHGLKGKFRENLYGRPLEIPINSSERSCNWMSPSKKVASKPTSWTRCTLSRLKLQSSQIMLSTGKIVLRTEEAQQYCCQGNRYACLRSATLGGFSCIRGIAKPAANFLSTYLSLSPPLLIWPWESVYKMYFYSWRETPVRIPGWSQTSFRSSVSVIWEMAAWLTRLPLPLFLNNPVPLRCNLYCVDEDFFLPIRLLMYTARQLIEITSSKTP